MAFEECVFTAWSEVPKQISRSVIAGLNGVLIGHTTRPSDSLISKLPYATSAIANLRRAGFAIIVLADADDSARAASGQVSSTTMAALELLDPHRQMIDYAVGHGHLANDGSICIRHLERELDQSIEGGWVVGDRPCHLDCGRALSLRSALVATGQGVSTWSQLSAGERAAVDIRSSMFAEATRHLLLAEGDAGLGETA